MGSAVSGYIQFIAGHVEAILPENREWARRVLAEVADRIGVNRYTRCRLVAMAAAVVALTFTGIRAVDALLDEDDTHQAIIVTALDGYIYEVILEALPGKPSNIVSRIKISPEKATHTLKQKGWQDRAIASFRAL